AQVLASLPELPAARFERYVAAGLSADDARTLVGERALADYFDAATKALPGKDKAVGNWVVNELLARLNAGSIGIPESPMPPERLAALVALVEGGTISGKIGKEVFDECYRSGEEPA